MGVVVCKRRMAAPRKRLHPFSWTESAMRPPQCTLTAAEVQRLFAHWLAPVLGPFPAARRCTAAAVCAVLAYAAHRLSSVTDACARLLGAPDGDTVLGRLARLLPGPDALERRLQAAL